MTVHIPPLGRVYKAYPQRVIDGDTFDFIPSKPVRVRPLGIDAAEKNSRDPEQRALAYEHEQWAEDWYAKRDPERIIIDGRFFDNFGRELVYIIYEGTASLAPSYFHEDFLQQFPGASYPASYQVAAAMAAERSPGVDEKRLKVRIKRGRRRNEYEVLDGNRRITVIEADRIDELVRLHKI